jgi:hypothetical protein
MIEEILKRIEHKLDGLASPRLNRAMAKKFLRIGEDRFRFLVKTGKVRELRDDFNEKYFLRNDLQSYLERGI